MDIDKIRCVSTRWQKAVNPYLYKGPYSAVNPIPNEIVNDSTFLNVPNNCRFGVGPITTVDELNYECENLVQYYDSIFTYKTSLSLPDGVYFQGTPHQIVYRGMTTEYAVNHHNFGLIQSFLHTSVNRMHSIGYLQLWNTDIHHKPVLYTFRVLQNSPYFSYDNNPFNSYYNLAESEVVFARNSVFIITRTQDEILTNNHGDVKRVKVIYADLFYSDQRQLINNRNLMLKPGYSCNIVNNLI
jgi:hypothetical protein